MAWPGRTGTPVLLVGTRLDDLAAMAASSFLGVCVEVREARGGVEPPRPLRDRLFSGQRPAPSLGWPRLRCQGRARTCGASGQNRGWDAVAHLAWGVWRGSNPLPPGSRPGASIASASDTERTAGLEPATSTMARWRADLLRYVRETCAPSAGIEPALSWFVARRLLLWTTRARHISISLFSSQGANSWNRCRGQRKEPPWSVSRRAAPVLTCTSSGLGSAASQATAQVGVQARRQGEALAALRLLLVPH